MVAQVSYLDAGEPRSRRPHGASSSPAECIPAEAARDNLDGYKICIYFSIDNS